MGSKTVRDTRATNDFSSPNVRVNSGASAFINPTTAVNPDDRMKVTSTEISDPMTRGVVNNFIQQVSKRIKKVGDVVSAFNAEKKEEQIKKMNGYSELPNIDEKQNFLFRMR